MLRADQIHQLVSVVVVQADRACTGVLLVTGQLLAGGGVVQAVGTRRAILVVVAHHQPVGGGRAVAAAGVEVGKGRQLCLIDHLALPILHLHGAVEGQIIAPFVFLHIVCRDIADFKGQIAACYAASVGVFWHSQLLTRGKVDHPAIACGVVVVGGIGHLFRCGQDQQAAGQDSIVGTVKGQDLLAAAVAQGGCPPGGGTGVRPLPQIVPHGAGQGIRHQIHGLTAGGLIQHGIAAEHGIAAVGAVAVQDAQLAVVQRSGSGAGHLLSLGGLGIGQGRGRGQQGAGGQQPCRGRQAEHCTADAENRTFHKRTSQVWQNLTFLS